MEAQVTAVTRSAFYHFKMVKQLVLYLTTSDVAMVIYAMVTSRSHYCNLEITTGTKHSGMPADLIVRVDTRSAGIALAALVAGWVWDQVQGSKFGI